MAALTRFPEQRDSPAVVAVAVVSFNTRDLLCRCLASLQGDAGAGRAEVWVVDNASHDGSADLVRERFPWATLIASKRNLGFGQAVNLVAPRTRAAWIAPANADVEVTDGALDALVSAGESHAKAGAIAPRLVLPNGATQHSVYAFPTLTFTTLFNLNVQQLSHRLGDRMCLEGYWNPDRARTVDWAIGAFLLVRRAAWDDVGGFDPAHWMYAEDLDLGWRLNRSGWTTWYEPGAVVRHAESAATRQVWGDDRKARWLASTYAWQARRHGLSRARITAVINVIGAMSRWAALTPAAAIRRQRWAPARADNRRWAALHRRVGLGARSALERHR